MGAAHQHQQVLGNQEIHEVFKKVVVKQASNIQGQFLANTFVVKKKKISELTGAKFKKLVRFLSAPNIRFALVEIPLTGKQTQKMLIFLCLFKRNRRNSWKVRVSLTVRWPRAILKDFRKTLQDTNCPILPDQNSNELIISILQIKARHFGSICNPSRSQLLQNSEY